MPPAHIVYGVLLIDLAFVLAVGTACAAFGLLRWSEGFLIAIGLALGFDLFLTLPVAGVRLIADG